MALVLTRVAIDTTLATNDRGGPARFRQGDQFLVVQTGSVLNAITIAADTIGITSTAGPASGDGTAVHPTADVIFLADDLGTLHALAYDPTTHAVGASIATVAHGVGTCNDITTNADGTVVFVIGQTSPFVRSVTFNGSAFGAMVSPAAGRFPGATAVGKGKGRLAFNATTGHLAAATGSDGTGIFDWPMTGTTFGVPYSPVGDVIVNGVVFNAAGTRLFAATAADPFVVAYTDTGAALTDPASPTTVTPGAGSLNAVLLDANEQYVICAGSNADGAKMLYGYDVTAYPTFGARIDATNPPAAAITGIALSSDNTRLIAWDIGEDLNLYSTNLTVGVAATASGSAAPGRSVWRKNWSKNWRDW